MKLNVLPQLFSVCKLTDLSLIPWDEEYIFVAKTADELSLVCPSVYVPSNTIVAEDDWRAIKIDGTLDFSMVGVLAGISGVLAENQISLFAISTYDTDYFLIKADKLGAATAALSQNGYEIIDRCSL